MTQAQVKSELIHLMMVQMVEGGLSTTPEYQRQMQYPSNFDLNIGYQTFANPEQNEVVVRLQVDLAGINGKNKNNSSLGISAKYVYNFHFKVDNLSEFINDKETISGLLGVTLLSISYSTLRGIVLERTCGTLLGGVILPVVNPAKLLKENALPPPPDVTEPPQTKS